MAGLKINTKKINKFLNRIPRILAQKAFLVFSILLLISLAFGAMIFYQYNILAKQTEVRIVQKPLQFQEKTLQEILDIWQKREKIFQDADLKNYSNPFQPKENLSIKEATSTLPGE